MNSAKQYMNSAKQWTHVRLLFTRSKKKKKAENVDAAKRQETRKPNTHIVLKRGKKYFNHYFLIVIRLIPNH